MIFFLENFEQSVTRFLLVELRRLVFCVWKCVLFGRLELVCGGVPFGLRCETIRFGRQKVWFCRAKGNLSGGETLPFAW